MLGRPTGQILASTVPWNGGCLKATPSDANNKLNYYYIEATQISGVIEPPPKPYNTDQPCQ